MDGSNANNFIFLSTFLHHSVETAPCLAPTLTAAVSAVDACGYFPSTTLHIPLSTMIGP